ncbi:MAG TPA: hypothetical protein VMR41_03255 [Patescibacteria group bacterium]|nr:hypothetical protein [Patescibacteria group bacterium]
MQIGIYERGLTISGPLRNNGNKGAIGSREVKGFSKHCRKALTWQFLQGPWKSMLTLTLHEHKKYDYKVVKKQLNSWLQNMRDNEIKYLWILEFQHRGTHHFHVWMDRQFDDVPEWEDDKGNSWRWLMKSWLNITNQNHDLAAEKFAFHQSTYVNWTIDVRANYATKYAAKNQQKVLPKGVEKFGRWCGWSRGIELIKEIIDIGGKENKYLCRQDKLACIKAKRCIKRLVEHHSKYRFTRDEKKMMLPMKLIIRESLVDACLRIIDYCLFGTDVSRGFEPIPF